MANTPDDNPQDKSNGRTAIRSTMSEVYRAAVSAIRQRGIFAGQAGLQFDGDRDLYANLGYDRDLTPGKYRDRYERGGIAERIVEAYPRATWSSGARVVEDPTPDVSTKFEEEVQVLFERLDVWARLMRADIVAGLGRYSVLMIGAEGELNTELPRFGSSEQVLYLQALSEEMASIEATVKDAADPRFGQPEFYKVTFVQNGQSKSVHWTRIVHIAEGLLIDDTYGKPRLRATWNYLNDLDKIVGGGAEAAWKNMDRGMQLDLNPEVVLDEAGENALMEEVEDYINGSRRFMRTRGVQLNQLGSSAVAFGGNVDSLLMLVSATTGIPHRILTGSERGQLASTTDRNNWNDRNAERQAEFATPVTMTLIDRLIQYGALPEPIEYTIEWPDFEDMDEQQKADIAGRYADANSKQTTAGDTLLITSDEIRQNLLDLDPLDDIVEPDQADTGSADDVSIEDEEIVAQGMSLGHLPGFEAVAETADHDAAEPEWKAVHQAADENREAATGATLNYWDRARRDLDGARLTRSLASDSIEGSITIVKTALAEAQPKYQSDMTAIALATMTSSAETVEGDVVKRGSWTRDGSPLPRAYQLAEGDVFGGIFDASDPGTIRWAEERSSALITEILPETEAAIREIISRGIAEGIPPRQLAREIRQHIGLRSDQVKALENFASQDGVTEKQIARYRQKLLNDRAILIARSETMRSANAGQRDLWRQAIAKEQLPRDVLRVFIATPDERTRPAHAEADGEVAPLDGEFPSGIEPGVPPNCRCAQGIASQKDVDEFVKGYSPEVS